MMIQRRFSCFIVLLVIFIAPSFSPAYASDASDEIKTMLSNMGQNAENIVDYALAQDAAGSQQMYQKILQRMDQCIIIWQVYLLMNAAHVNC